jgi:alpha-1,3-mannosyl-glycoprotein beta-1,2-N-acetylglucosaminyltransferase
MEDLKAGVPRTAYHGVVMLRIGGRRVFLTPGFAVDQDITKPGSTGDELRKWGLLPRD